MAVRARVARCPNVIIQTTHDGRPRSRSPNGPRRAPATSVGYLVFAHIPKEGPDITTTDKAKNSAQQGKGKMKEAAGKLSGNDKLRAEGKADQTKGNLKQAGEKVKDAFSK